MTQGAGNANCQDAISITRILDIVSHNGENVGVVVRGGKREREQRLLDDGN